MEILIILLTLVAVIAALLVVPEIRKYVGLDKKVTLKIEGLVGQLGKSTEFNTFIQKNDGKIVFINIHIPEEEFDGILEEKNPYFVFYDKCYDLECGEKPSVSKCTGIEYNISNLGNATDYSFYFMRGFYKIRGYFAILGLEGPHQGLMGVNLKPVNYENVKQQLF